MKYRYPYCTFFIFIFLLLRTVIPALAQNDPAGERLRALYVSALKSGVNYIVDQGAYRALFDSTGNPLTPFKFDHIATGLSGNFVATIQDQPAVLLDESGQTKAILGMSNVYLRRGLRQYVAYNRDYNRVFRKRVYDENGAAVVFYEENEEPDELVIINDNQGGYYLTDTSGKRITEKSFQQISMGRKLLTALRNDSCYIFSKKGRLLYQGKGKDIKLADEDAPALFNGVFWILTDSTGKKIHNGRFRTIEKTGVPGFVKADNNIVVTRTGKPVLNNEYAYSITQNGNWYKLDLEGTLEDLFLDAQLKPLFQDQHYERKEFTGDRFILLYKKYSDAVPLVYDRKKKQYSNLPVRAHFSGDYYLAEEHNTGLKHLIKEGKILDIGPFRNISRLDSSFYLLDDYKPPSHERSFRALSYTPAKPALKGLLDKQMKVVVPMQFRDIEILANNIIVVTDSAGSKSILDRKGKLVSLLADYTGIYRNGAVIHAYGPKGSLLLDTLGRTMYKGSGTPALLFSEGTKKSLRSFPALLMIDNSSGYFGVYDTGLHQILPDAYYGVKNPVPGIFGIKKGDSVYYTNSHGTLLYRGIGYSGNEHRQLSGYALILKDQSGKYGTLAPDGSMVLPFAYDTLFNPDQSGYVIGKNGQYALLDPAGQLCYPLQHWMPISINRYGFIRGSDHQLYAVVNGKVVDAASMVNENMWREINRDAGKFIMVQPENDFGLASGVYNPSLKRVARLEKDFYYQYHHDMMTVPGTDSGTLNIIDTNGHILIRSLSQKSVVAFYDSAIAVIDTSNADLLYLKNKGHFEKHDIEISEEDETVIKKRLLQYSNLYGIPYRFKKNKMIPGIITAKGAVYLDSQATAISLYDQVYLIKQSGGYGLLEASGRFVQEPVADTIYRLDPSAPFTIIKGNGRGIYHPGAGVPYIPPLYDRIYSTPAHYEPNVRLVRKDKKYTLIGTEGQQILPWLDSIAYGNSSVDHTAAYLNGTEMSLNYDDEGNIILEKQVQLESINGYREHLAIVAHGRQYGLYDNRACRFILPVQYDGIAKSEHGKLYFAYRYKTDKLSGIDSTIIVGQRAEVISRAKGFYPVSDYVPAGMAAGLAAAPAGMIPAGYSIIHQLPGRALWIVEKDQQKGICNKKGKLLIPAVFEDFETETLSFGFITGTREKRENNETISRSCLISPEGKILTKAKYEEISDNEWYETGTKACFIVQKRDRYGIIDNKGKEILPIAYDAISGVYDDEIALLQKQELWGAMNVKTRKEIIPFAYDSLIPGASGTIYYQKGTESGSFDKTGKQLTGQP